MDHNDKLMDGTTGLNRELSCSRSPPAPHPLGLILLPAPVQVPVPASQLGIAQHNAAQHSITRLLAMTNAIWFTWTLASGRNIENGAPNAIDRRKAKLVY